jgi:outer membrane protein assembly factor BamC
MRDGDQRWLIVSAEADIIWPQLVEYWTKDGIPLVINSPESGVIETDWLINYADFTSSFGKVFRGILNKITESGRRDKYRISIDFGQEAGTTEVYVAHRGMEEVALGPSRTQIPDYKWVKRPSDPSLELAIMRQIMVYLGVDEDEADSITEQSLPDEVDKARLLIDDVDEPVLVLDEAFPRAWQRVGLALDRSGYIVVGRNRQQGGYLIELANSDLIDEKKQGFFSRLFNRDKKDDEEIIYKAQVRLIPQKEEKTVVAIATEEGLHDSSETAISLLQQLYEQLK